MIRLEHTLNLFFSVFAVVNQNENKQNNNNQTNKQTKNASYHHNLYKQTLFLVLGLRVENQCLLLRSTQHQTKKKNQKC
jgi:hypothetical protein